MLSWAHISTFCAFRVSWLVRQKSLQWFTAYYFCVMNLVLGCELSTYLCEIVVHSNFMEYFVYLKNINQFYKKFIIWFFHFIFYFYFFLGGTRYFLYRIRIVRIPSVTIVSDEDKETLPKQQRQNFKLHGSHGWKKRCDSVIYLITNNPYIS